ncbi:LysR substrate-binding domain-containing protein, partial [Rhizobium ruizarguesonis]
DIAVVALPASGRNFEIEPFYEEELLAVAPADSLMPDGGPDASFMRDRTLLLYEGGNTRRAIDAWLASRSRRMSSASPMRTVISRQGMDFLATA